MEGVAVSQIERIVDKLATLAELRARRKQLELAGFSGHVSVPVALGKPPAWDACTLASCWAGHNAAERRMNMLSPAMPPTIFDAYLQKMLDAGCNTAHLFVANRADGEYGGYSIYGPEWGWQINTAFCRLMLDRIEDLRAAGFGIVLWLMADDSGPYAAAAKSNFPRYVSDLRTQGFFRQASTVVVGLELDEYWSRNESAALAACVRQVYDGKIGTHQTSSKYDYASGIADILFYQVNPGMSPSGIEREARKVRAATGLPLNFFELSREPDRERCVAAMAGGAFGVGNWDGGPL